MEIKTLKFNYPSNIHSNSMIKFGADQNVMKQQFLRGRQFHFETEKTVFEKFEFPNFLSKDMSASPHFDHGWIK